jgi:hypothetical protein
MAVTTAAVIGAAAAAGSAVNSADSQRKALHAQQDALKNQQQQLGPNGSLEQSTAELSKQNAIASAELEKQLTPEVPLLRQQSNQALLQGMGDGSYDMSKAKGLLSGGMGVPMNTPLLNAAIAKAQSDLSLGGSLDRETQNLVTRKGLATAASVGGGGLGLGRDVVARDLGLTGLQIQQQRLQNASQLGGQELALGQSNATNLLNHITLLNSINQGDFGRRLAVAQYAEGIGRPTVGLDPGSAANLQMANQNAQGQLAANAANVKGAQNAGYLNAAGQIGGALLAYNNRQQPNIGYTPATNNDIYQATYANTNGYIPATNSDIYAATYAN